MNPKNLQELREKLNIMIENGASHQDILKVSEELDSLIATFMENKYEINSK